MNEKNCLRIAKSFIKNKGFLNYQPNYKQIMLETIIVRVIEQIFKNEIC